MVLQFNEAPDYASILERDYEKQNRGFENREAAEQANDRRRIQNAGVPLEVITSLISFSGTAKKMADGIKDQQNERQLDYYQKNLKGMTTLQRQVVIDKNERGLDILKDDYKARLKVRDKFLTEGQIIEAIQFAEDSEYKKGRFGILKADVNKAISDFESDFAKDVGDLTGFNATEKEDKWNAYEAQVTRKFNKYPDALTIKLHEKLEQKKAVFLKEIKNEEVGQIEKRNDDARLYELSETLKADDLPTFEKNALSMLDLLMAEKRITFTEAVEYLQEDILKLVESNVIPESVARKFEAVTILHKGKKGHPREEILKSHAKTFSKTNWDDRLTEASQNAIAIRDQNKFNYQKQVEQNIQGIEDEQGHSMTNVQLAEYLKENYDPSKGGPIPDGLTNRLTKEKADDNELVRQLDHKWDKGIPFSKEEVMKLNDRDLENAWLQKVTETNPNIPPKNLKDEAFSLIDKYVSKHTKERSGSKDKSVKWQNNQINAQRAYSQIYARRIQTSASPDQAHLDTLKELQGNIELGLYDELATTDPTRAVNRELALVSASDAIALNPDIVNTGIIYGSEDVIKEAAELPEGEVHLFYQQLGNKVGVNGHVLQYRQLEIAAELKGEGKPVKSKILQEYEKLDTTTQELLSRHTSPARVQRAIIEEYGKDGDISYEDVGVLLDEVLAEYPVKETVIEQSTKASMAPSPRTTNRPEGEVALLDKPEVKEAIDILVDRAKSLLPEVFYGKETSQALMSDITKSLEKQKEIASKRRRRRGR